MTTPFLQRAAELGHSTELRASGHQVTTQIQVPHLEALKALIAPGTDTETRQRLGHALLGEPAPTDPEQDASATAILGRVNAFLYEHADLTDTDRARVANLFPLTVTATSVPTMTLTSPWELGTSAPLLTYNVGTLQLLDGGCVIVRNSTLQFSVDTIVREGAAPAGYSDFNILGVDGGSGTPGTAGGGAGAGAAGAPGTCLRPEMAGAPGGAGGPGVTGATGLAGGAGGGRLPSMPATITITTAITSGGAISFQTQSGAGGIGGKGGPGGTGGEGGAGGYGAICNCEGTSGGNGGPGGMGGNGGHGGAGGNGADAAGNLIITTAPELIGKIAEGVQLPAPGGDGGDGGDPGQPGPGGQGGGPGKNSNAGNAGGPGGPGSTGGRGSASTVIGQPATISAPQPI